MNRISDILRQKREEMGRHGYQVVVHLVGIRYHRELSRLNKDSRVRMLQQAGLNPNFDTELMKGAKLGRHVKIHPDSQFADCLDLENQTE
ncbi:MAG: HTH-like domain-containing protein [Gammaproteobacteria bacterium]